MLNLSDQLSLSSDPDAPLGVEPLYLTDMRAQTHATPVRMDAAHEQPGRARTSSTCTNRGRRAGERLRLQCHGGSCCRHQAACGYTPVIPARDAGCQLARAIS